MPGGSTVIIKSEGAMAANQPDVLGVYRMVDSFDNRPVYKQDGGENYIYYRCRPDKQTYIATNNFLAKNHNLPQNNESAIWQWRGNDQ